MKFKILLPFFVLIFYSFFFANITYAQLAAPSGLAYECSVDGTKVKLKWKRVFTASEYQLRIDKITGNDPEWAPDKNQGDLTPKSNGSECPAGSLTTAGTEACQTLNINPNAYYEWSAQSLPTSSPAFSKEDGPGFTCTPQKVQIKPESFTWNVKVSAICEDGNPSTVQTRVDWGLWPTAAGASKEIDWQSDQTESGIHQIRITSRDNLNSAYLKMFVFNSGWIPLELSKDLIDPNIKYGTYFGGTNTLVWKRNDLAQGNYTFKFKLPDSFCKKTTPKAPPIVTETAGTGSTNSPSIPAITSCTPSKTSVGIGEELTYTMIVSPGSFANNFSYSWEDIEGLPVFDKTSPTNTASTLTGSFKSAGSGTSKIRAAVYYANQVVKKDCDSVTVATSTPVTSTQTEQSPKRVVKVVVNDQEVTSKDFVKLKVTDSNEAKQIDLRVEITYSDGSVDRSVIKFNYTPSIQSTSAPANLQIKCNSDGKGAEISWSANPEAKNGYLLRVDKNPPSWNYDRSNNDDLIVLAGGTNGNISIDPAVKYLADLVILPAGLTSDQQNKYNPPENQHAKHEFSCTAQVDTTGQTGQPALTLSPVAQPTPSLVTSKITCQKLERNGRNSGKILSPDTVTEVSPGQAFNIVASIIGDDGRRDNIKWSATEGTFNGSWDVVDWVAPQKNGEYKISMSVDGVNQPDCATTFKVTGATLGVSIQSEEGLFSIMMNWWFSLFNKSY